MERIEKTFIVFIAFMLAMFALEVFSLNSSRQKQDPYCAGYASSTVSKVPARCLGSFVR